MVSQKTPQCDKNEIQKEQTLFLVVFIVVAATVSGGTWLLPFVARKSLRGLRIESVDGSADPLQRMDDLFAHKEFFF